MNETPAIEYNEKTRVHKFNGQITPSVTQVLSCCGMVPDFSKMPGIEDAVQRGLAVHKVTELFDMETLDLNRVDDALIPYLKAYERFLLDSGFKNDEIENIVFSELYRCFGRVDRYGWLNGGRAIIDIKSGKAGISAGPQTAGYALLCDSNPWTIKRFALELRADASYGLIPQDDPGDFNLFIAALAVTHWKMQNGLWRPENGN